MNAPDPEIGGLIEGSHESCDTRVSPHVRPASFERARNVSMKKFPGWFGGGGRAGAGGEERGEPAVEERHVDLPLRRHADVRLELVGVGDVLVHPRRRAPRAAAV